MGTGLGSGTAARVAVWAAVLATACSSGSTPAEGVTSSGGPTAGSVATQAGARAPAAEGGKAAPPLASGGAPGSAPADRTAPAAGSGGTAGAAMASGGAGAPAAVGGAPSAGAPSSSPQGAVAWPAISNFSMMGPFKPVTKLRSGPMNAYTLFYPEELGQDGLKHPVITWGNGATSTPDQFTLLPLLASHGFFVIAANNAFVTSAEMKSGIDWALMENDSDGSDFHQKLDPTKCASMGWSLGSLGTFEIADDPRLLTTVHISGGAMDKSVVPNLRHPAAFFCGDPSDIAHDNCESDFEMAKVPVFYGVFPGDHFGIVSANFAPQINAATAAWVRWRLMGDTSVASMFVGPDCTLCKDSKWTVKQKDFDTAPP